MRAWRGFPVGTEHASVAARLLFDGAVTDDPPGTTGALVAPLRKIGGLCARMVI